MLAYEFYLNDGRGEPSLIGILPERRKHSGRITEESIMRWGRLAAGSHVDPNSIHYIRVGLPEDTMQQNHHHLLASGKLGLDGLLNRY